MNDEFLTQFCEAPRAEFADALYERISRGPRSRFVETMGKKLTFRNAAVVFAFLFLIVACVYAVSEKRWNKVGDIWVEVQRTIKVDNPSLSGEPLVMEFQPECFSIDEAREILRFSFKIPAWAPEGFTLDGRVCFTSIVRISDYARLYWEGADTYSGIQFMASNVRWYDQAMQKYKIGPPAVWMPVAPGSYDEVQVNGRPAVLVRGDWELPNVVSEVPPDRELDANQQLEVAWDRKRGLQLYWVDGEVMYHLDTRADVSPEDLIKMAESAR